MQTEIKHGDLTAVQTVPIADKWALILNHERIALIELNGLKINWHNSVPPIDYYTMIDIVVLMRLIEKQYNNE